MKPVVSILCITYNHVEFITDALEGFLMQNTTFPFEVLIHDDASTDGTSDIIRAYEKKYPEIIKPIYQKENQFSKGVKIFYTYQYPRAKGRYVALCEGDDFWTDPNKLQRQVNFLEENSEFSLCFHEVSVISNNNKDYNTWKRIAKRDDGVFTINDLLEFGNFIHTTTVVFRNKLDNMKFIPSITGDYFLHLHNASFGKIKFMNEVMATYRVHQDGVFSQRDNWPLQIKIRNSEIQLAAYEKAKAIYSKNYNHRRLFNKLIFNEGNKLRIYLLEKQERKKARNLVRKLIVLFINSSQKDIKTFFSIIMTFISPKLLSKKILEKK